ncbi:MAG: ATP-binding protein, partial [Mycobacterium sp.]|nr:ATP-binding protein [Mycobacterium sp.]
MLDTLAVANYRSLRRLTVPLRRCTVVTGPNGSGKSSLYRSLRLLADMAHNGAVNALAREGGLASTMWAGPGRTGPVSLKLGFAGEEVGYAVDLGMPNISQTAFGLDPEIKAEAVWTGPWLRPATLMAERAGPTARVRDDDGTWRIASTRLRPYDSMVSELADPRDAPEVLALRERMRSWRFYDHIRTDVSAPARQAR